MLDLLTYLPHRDNILNCYGRPRIPGQEFPVWESYGAAEVVRALLPSYSEETIMARGDEAALIAAAIRGESLAAIAAAATLSKSSVQRRLAEPHTIEAIRRGRAQLRDEAVGQLSTARSKGIGQLPVLLDHEDPDVVLRAIGDCTVELVEVRHAFRHRCSATRNGARRRS